jgi:hypothetical protein
VDFLDEELRQLRMYFEYLDKDKGGSISAEELEEPLVALGFAESREDVQTLINAIDRNGNGEIELDEFLAIIKTAKVSLASHNCTARGQRTAHRHLLQAHDQRRIQPRTNAHPPLHQRSPPQNHHPIPHKL